MRGRSSLAESGNWRRLSHIVRRKRILHSAAMEPRRRILRSPELLPEFAGPERPESQTAPYQRPEYARRPWYERVWCRRRPKELKSKNRRAAAERGFVASCLT